MSCHAGDLIHQMRKEQWKRKIEDFFPGGVIFKAEVDCHKYLTLQHCRALTATNATASDDPVGVIPVAVGTAKSS